MPKNFQVAVCAHGTKQNFIPANTVLTELEQDGGFYPEQYLGRTNNGEKVYIRFRSHCLTVEFNNQNVFIGYSEAEDENDEGGVCGLSFILEHTGLTLSPEVKEEMEEYLY